MSYDVLLIEPLKEMLVRVTSFIPTLLLGLVVLFAGWMLAHGVRYLLNRFFKAIHFDKFFDTIRLSTALRKGGIKQKPGELVSCIIYSVLMVMVFILTIKALGLTFVADSIDKVLAYIPSVITGVFVLIVGMLVAKVVSSIVYVVAKISDMPVPDALGHLTKITIVAYVGVIYLKEIGFFSIFMGDYSVFIWGLTLSLALAFGLAGKDIASRYLDVLKRHSH